MIRAVFFAFILLAAAPAMDAHAAQAAKYSGDVVLVRGGFNVFSRGIDVMAQRLAKDGIAAQAIPYGAADRTVARLIAKRKTRKGRGPLVLIGHSWGANTVIDMANALRKAKVKVDYVVMLAATNPDRAPANVKRLTNYFFVKDGWGKPVLPAPGFKGRLRNIDLSKRVGITHFNLDKNARIQKDVLKRVRLIMRRGGNS